MNRQKYTINLHDFSYPLMINSLNFNFIMIISGKLDIKINDTEYHFSNYDFFNISPDMTYQIINGRGCLAYIFSYDWDDLMNYLDLSELTYIFSNKIPNSIAIDLTTNFVDLIEASNQSNMYSGLLIHSYFLKFLYSLSTIPDRSKIDLNNEADRSTERKNAIRRFIRTKSSTPIQLIDLANEVYLTPQYLANFIKKEFNNTFLKMVLEVRLEKAKRQLLETKESITKIALNTGFPNSQSFNVAFKNQNKVTPSEYRNTHKIVKESILNTDISAETIQKANTELIGLRKKITSKSINYNYLYDIDAHASVQNFESNDKTWLEVINLGFAESILSSTFQDHIVQVQSELHFKYGRIQGILNPHIIDKIPDSRKFSFTNFNRIIDFMYSVNLIPYIELGNKPFKFNIESNQYQYISFDKFLLSLEDWENFINEFILNFINRYGKDEVSKWHFELWLPHDIQLNYNQKSINQYIEEFTILHRIIKKNLPDAKIGGFGFNVSADFSVIRSVQLELSKNKISFDFFSFISFYFEKEEDNKGMMTPHHDYLEIATKAIKRSIYPQKIPLYLSEFSFGVASRNYIHDSVFHAVFLLYNVLNNYKDFKGMGFWRLTDLSEEYKDINTPLFGGNGLVSVDGLRKPVFHAYKLLTYLGNNVICSGSNFIITTKGSESIQILLFNYAHPTSMSLSKLSTVLPNQVNDLFVEIKENNYRFTLDNVLSGRYRFKTYYLNRDFGSVLDHWVKLGTNIRLNKNEIDYIQHISRPKQSIDYLDIENQIVVEGTINTNEIKLIHINLEY